MSGGLRQRRAAWAVLGLLIVGLLAVGASEPPDTGSSQDRVFAIAEEMKCLACAGESVANSQSPLAIEMRDEIRRQARSGLTDDEILTYFADRYGNRVLLKPSGEGLVSFVWIVPVVVAGLAVALLALAFRRWRSEATQTAELSDEDRALIEAARERRHE